MRSKIHIREDSIKVAVEVNSKIIEFDAPYSKKYFEARYKGKEKVILVAYHAGNPAGYIVAYDRDGDDSFYCWMAGVDPKFRRKGILTALMAYLEKWAKEYGYEKIRVKTRNNRREMLHYLVKAGFNFIEIQEKSEIKEYRILLEKKLAND